MKVLSLIGARPQFIKEAILQEKLKENGIQEIVVHSGQHYDYNMSDVFFKVLKMREPDYNLNVGSGSHAVVTGKIMIAFEEVVVKEKPDIIVVYGDTNTTVAGALVGAKLKIPIAHVEAGIRQEPKDMPEEINRVLTDHVSTYLFCPSELAVENLEKENIKKEVYFVGDIMYDLFLKMKPYFDYSILRKYDLKENEYIVCTIHRDFNTDDPNKLKGILEGISYIADLIKIIFPVHPRTQKRIAEFGLESLLRNVIVTEPLDYLKMMGLLENSLMVITDSGGLQKEAYFSGKRAIVLMPDTGWKELIELGWNKVTSPDNLFSCYQSMVSEENRKPKNNVYGEGKAGEKIVNIIKGLIK
ncbi:MAG: UDP-N-acetylglucosamine 2-epimerase (non-hydrolyzing) [Thermosediminibacteraceae bacterium]|nr:UDP-N-acetylglucosamine 2-epimerase (non-hydrolyzing) [Thermosediminibacteraceae bacterium]